jgi:hypothetical protein
MSTQHFQVNIQVSLNQIIDIVRQLSPKEKLQLVGVIWDETSETDIDIPLEHHEIVKQRLKRMEDHPESCLSWKDIESKIRL